MSHNPDLRNINPNNNADKSKDSREEREQLEMEQFVLLISMLGSLEELYSAYMSVCLSACLSVCMSLSLCLSISLFLSLSLFLFRLYPFLNRSVCRSFYLCTCIHPSTFSSFNPPCMECMLCLAECHARHWEIYLPGEQAFSFAILYTITLRWWHR